MPEREWERESGEGVKVESAQHSKRKKTSSGENVSAEKADELGLTIGGVSGLDVDLE